MGPLEARSIAVLTLLPVLVFFPSDAGFAQTGAAAVNGTVTDQSGAAISEVRITQFRTRGYQRIFSRMPSTVSGERACEIGGLSCDGQMSAFRLELVLHAEPVSGGMIWY